MTRRCPILIFFLIVFLSCDRLEVADLEWQKVELPFTHDLSRILVMEDGSWHLVGGETWETGQYLSTFDEGNSWDQIELHDKQLFGLDHDEDNNLYVTGISSFLYFKKPSKDNWEVGNPIVWARGNDLAFFNSNKGILVGGEALINGHLIVYGENFIPIEQQIWDREISTVTYTNESTWFVAGFGFIAKSINGGLDWVLNEFNGDFFVDLMFVDDDIAYCIGNSGTIAKTVNGGETWEAQRDGYDVFTSDLAFRAVYFVNESLGFICGEEGLLIYTEDGGEEWKQISDLPEIDFFDVYYSGEFGLLAGEDGNLIRFEL